MPDEMPRRAGWVWQQFAECLSTAFHNYGNVSMKRIPLLAEEGWLRHQKKPRSHRTGADGVVQTGAMFRPDFY